MSSSSVCRIESTACRAVLFWFLFRRLFSESVGGFFSWAFSFAIKTCFAFFFFPFFARLAAGEEEEEEQEEALGAFLVGLAIASLGARLRDS